jgi:threonine dehydrogenase-like Zn-dependent dehydrogenase
MENGVMKMRAIPKLALPAGKTVDLKPGGYHVMLMDLTQPLKDGETVPVTLIFADKDGKRVTHQISSYQVVSAALSAPSKSSNEYDRYPWQPAIGVSPGDQPLVLPGNMGCLMILPGRLTNVTAFFTLQAPQRIAISPSRPCGNCRFCQFGQHNHCLNMRFFGSAMPFPHIQDAFAEQLIIEAYQAHAIGKHLSLSEAALAEPLSVGLHAIQRAGGVLGKQVFVTGCGPIGSLLIGALRRAGAARIVAADIADLPLKCAKEMGADETINLKTQPQLLDKYKADKGQFEAVFEASGSEPALRAGLDVIMPRGVLVTVGMGGDMSLPMTQLVAKEVDLRGTFRFHAEFATAVQFLNEGLINGKPVITGILPPLNEAAWHVEFEKYKQIPQYAELFPTMTLGQFKTIFFWEWGHRILGRVIGLAFALPLAFFWLRGVLPSALKPKLVGLLALGAQRALVVRKYLALSGVSAGRLFTVSYGQSRPADTALTEDAWRRNRRCEFRLAGQ